MRIKRIMITVLLISTITTVAAAADTKYANSRNGLRVRDKPGTEGKVLSVLPFGEEFLLRDDGDYGDWYMIIFGDEEAYVSSEFTQDTNPLDDMTYMGEWRITAYSYTGSPCANGNYPQPDYTIACNSLPFGTEVYISGVGFRTVEDRGPAWLGSEWLDLYMVDTDQCIQWGDRYRDVYVVKEKE